jgi:hypothetical protein
MDKLIRNVTEMLAYAGLFWFFVAIGNWVDGHDHWITAAFVGSLAFGSIMSNINATRACGSCTVVNNVDV